MKYHLSHSPAGNRSLRGPKSLGMESVPQPGGKSEPERHTSWGVNFFEQPVVLGEAYGKERIKCPALKAGHFRTTLSESPVSSTRETSLVRSVLIISEPSTTLRKKLNETGSIPRRRPPKGATPELCLEGDLPRARPPSLFIRKPYK